MRILNSSPGRLRSRFLILLVSLPVFLTGISGCKSTYQFTHLPEPPQVASETLNLSGNSRGQSSDGLILTFPGQLEEVLFEKSSSTLAVNYYPDSSDSGKLKQYALYDLQADSIRWSGNGNPRLNFLKDDLLLLDYGSTRKVYNAVDGQFIRDAETDLWTLGRDEAYILNKHNFSRIEVESGEQIWTCPGKDWLGFREETLTEDWLYVVAKGLHAMRREDGTYWYWGAKTGKSGEGAAFFKSFLLAMVSPSGYSYGYATAKATHNASSNILIAEDTLYFSATDKICAIDQETGKPLWETQTRNKWEPMLLQPGIQSDIVLIGLGYKWVDYAVKESQPATITLLDKARGTVKAEFQMDVNDVVLDFAQQGGNYFLLTGSKIISFDHALGVLESHDNESQYGNYLYLMAHESELLIRTTQGILSFDPATFRVNWFQDLSQAASSPQISSFSGLLAATERALQNSWSEGDIYWLTVDKHLLGVDLEQKAEVLWEIPIAGSDYWFEDDGTFLSVHDKQIDIIHLTHLSK